MATLALVLGLAAASPALVAEERALPQGKRAPQGGKSAGQTGAKKESVPCVDLPTRSGDKLAYGERKSSRGDACCEGLYEQLTSAQYPTGQVEVIGYFLTARGFEPAQDRVIELVVPASEQQAHVSATLVSPNVRYRMDGLVGGVAAGEPLNPQVDGQSTGRVAFHWDLSVLDRVQERASQKIRWQNIMTVAFQEDRPIGNARGRVYIPMHVNPPAPTGSGAEAPEPAPEAEGLVQVDIMVRAIGGSIPRVTGKWIRLADPKTSITPKLEQTIGSDEVCWMTVELPSGSGTWMLRLYSESTERREFQRLFVQAPEAAFLSPLRKRPDVLEVKGHDD